MLEAVEPAASGRRECRRWVQAAYSAVRRRQAKRFVWHECKIDNIASLPESLDEFIAAAGWRFASSMPDIRHEYTVRGKATAGVDPPPVEWHDWFVEQVRRHGYKGKWGKRTFRYLEHGGWKFWVIGQVINRERLRASDDAARGGGSAPSTPKTASGS